MCTKCKGNGTYVENIWLEEGYKSGRYSKHVVEHICSCGAITEQENNTREECSKLDNKRSLKLPF